MLFIVCCQLKAEKEKVTSFTCLSLVSQRNIMVAIKGKQLWVLLGARPLVSKTRLTFHPDLQSALAWLHEVSGHENVNTDHFQHLMNNQSRHFSVQSHHTTVNPHKSLSPWVKCSRCGYKNAAPWRYSQTQPRLFFLLRATTLASAALAHALTIQQFLMRLWLS